MPADFDDLRHELESLRADTRHTALPGPAAARRRARQRARNQAIAGVLGVVVIVAGGVFAFAQPSLISAPDFANSPPDTASPTAEPSPEPSGIPTLPASALLTAADLDPEAGWVETEPPAEPWPCAPQPPNGEHVLRRSFDYPDGDGRIDQVVEATTTADEAAARLSASRDAVVSCVEEGGSDFALDQIWSVTGVGDETILIRYWAPPRQDEARLILSITLARSGSAVTSVTHGGFVMDANEPDPTDRAEAAVGRLCSATGGACVSDIDRELVFPEPAGDVPGWLRLADVGKATGLDQVFAGDVVPVEQGWASFVCLQLTGGSGAESFESRAYSDPLDTGGTSVQQTIARFGSDQEAGEYYTTLVAAGDVCGAEPSLTVENLGGVGGPETGFDGTVWRATAEGAGTVFLYGLVINGSAVSFVDLSAASADEEQMRELLTLAGERLGDLG